MFFILIQVAKTQVLNHVWKYINIYWILLFIQVYIIARLLFLNNEIVKFATLSYTYDITCKKEGNAADLLMVTFASCSIWYLFYGVYILYCTVL